MKKEMKLSVYDFDGTIYEGDCTIDFYKYCLKKYPYKIVHLPPLLFLMLLWKLGFISTKKFKEFFLSVTEWNNLKYDIKDFWDKHENRIFDWVDEELKRSKNEGLGTIIISSSPEFLLEEIKSRLGIDFLIGTNFVKDRIIGENCKSEEKVKRLFSKFSDEYNILVVKVFSDSIEDLPLYQLAEKKFRVSKTGEIFSGAAQN